MEEQLKTIIENYTLNAFQIALISVCVSVLTFLITNWLKNYFENKLLQRNLETEHKFEQQKKIKETIAKYKVHLLTACEDVNHRFWNFSDNHHRDWIKINGDYGQEHYYFHSTIYKFLCLYAWIGKIKKRNDLSGHHNRLKRGFRIHQISQILPKYNVRLNIHCR